MNSKKILLFLSILCSYNPSFADNDRIMNPDENNFYGDIVTEDNSSNTIQDTTEQTDSEITTVIDSNKQLLDKATSFIAKYEGFRSTPYPDHKRFSIGYGTAANGRTFISQEDAFNELEQNVEKTYKVLLDKGCSELSEGQKIALISFYYNLGFGNKKDYIIQLAKDGKIKQLKKEMLLYVKASGKKLSSLEKRRLDEINLF